MDARLLVTAVRQLLDSSPISRDEVRDDVRHLLAADEIALAFDTLCSWIFEDQVEISRDYLLRLTDVAGVLGVPGAVRRLEEVTRDLGERPATPGEPPRELDGARVFGYALVGPAHTHTGRTVHSVTNFADVVCGLALAQYDEDAIYLFYCDEEWNVVSDTCHSSEQDAVAQARFEFDGLDFHRLT
ncbi:hypothetical protein BBK82_09385 [Lentzea guizhouensis]|uniref:MafI family immunity protein n=1 Tax=Lentzea guizhouensis TaxID=1586287 RepID=A0A1B2HEV5_9PSEU|nr:MafI family immunity protein [Lentzea guizhouensis]ANZ36242.1 hypothetical protein BBK82_09385 [Lentzea guizhouensis]